jgi:hypothetical protein
VLFFCFNVLPWSDPPTVPDEASQMRRPR